MIYIGDTFNKLCSSHEGWLEHNEKTKNDKRLVLENGIILCSNLNTTILDKSMFNNITFVRCKFNKSRFNESLFMNVKFVNCDLEQDGMNRAFFSNCTILKCVVNGLLYNREEINGVGYDILKLLSHTLNIDMLLKEELGIHERIKVENNSLSHITLNLKNIMKRRNNHEFCRR